MGHYSPAQRSVRAGAQKQILISRVLKGGEANEIHWGKAYWIFEQLRQEDPDVVALYFQAKRRLATPDKVKRYDPSTTVALLSTAMKRDLFPWFKAHGIL